MTARNRDRATCPGFAAEFPVWHVDLEMPGPVSESTLPKLDVGTEPADSGFWR
jgi:hypothetical protein